MAYDIAVIGGGPAGLSAAVQARQRNKTVLVISGDDRDNNLYKAERIDNYLGLSGLSGAELLDKFRAHAEQMGAQRMTGRVLNIMPMGDSFYLGVGSEMVEAAAVVLATGVSQAGKVPGEEAGLGRGVSYCATCDGMLYRGRPVAVVGKTADAPEEANYLKGIGCRVTYVSDRVPAGLDEGIPFVKAAKLEVRVDTKVTALLADGAPIPCDGVFFLRPSVAPADLLPGLELDGSFIRVDKQGATSIPGVFAAGDCTGLPLQVSKAVGEGMTAGHRAAEYVDKLRRERQTV